MVYLVIGIVLCGTQILPMQPVRRADYDPESYEIRPASPEQFLPGFSQLSVWSGLVLLLVFGGTIALAGVLPYKVTVKAVAAIRPTGELRIVQSTTEGMVKQIAVTESQLIRQGDLIAVIDDSRLQTRKMQLQSDIRQTQHQLRQSKARLAALNRQIAAEVEQASHSLAATEAELALYQRTHQDRQRISQAEVREAEATVELAREEVNRYQQLSGTGAISQMQVKEKQASLKTAQARLERVKVGLHPSLAEVEMVQQKTAQERAKGTAVLATLHKEREQSLQEQGELRSQLEHARQELQQVKTELKNTIIRAPVSGVIQELTLHNPSQVVRLGDNIARILSDTAPLRIKARVAAQDIGKVKIGQTAFMRVSACPYPDYGPLQGQVITISPDTIGSSNPIEGSRVTQPGAGLYQVTVQPQTLRLQMKGRECPIQAGMEGRLEIVSREETVLQFFLSHARVLISR